MGRISTSYRYVIGITGTDPFSLGELGVVYLEKIKKLTYFNLRTGDQDLNEIRYLEGTHVSELFFQIPTRFC